MMNVIDHGSWQPYTPAKFPEGAPLHAMFAIRKIDHVDWYDYVNSGENFGANTVVFAAIEHDPEVGYVIGPATFDPTTIFPADHVLGEITDYTGRDPQTDFGGKIYDPVAGTITDPPPPPVLVSFEDNIMAVLGDITQRLAKFEQKGKR